MLVISVGVSLLMNIDEIFSIHVKAEMHSQINDIHALNNGNISTRNFDKFIIENFCSQNHFLSK